MSLFLDNAATSYPKPETVYRAIDAAMREIGVAPGRGGYRQSLTAARTVFETRSTLADFFGVPDSSRLVFTHSATESLNIAVSGLLKPGDHVVTTSMEHNALVRPLHLLRGRGVEVTFVQADREGRVSEREIAAAMRPGTRLVAVTHCSNVSGTIQPVGEIGKVARQGGAVFLVDAAQSAGYLPIDVIELGIDLLAAPGHKGLFGPPGTGILAIGEGIELEPLLVGGTGGNASSLEQPEILPERFESGTLNTPALAGLKAGVDFIRETGLEVIRAKEKLLVGMLLEGLSAMEEAVIYGPRGNDHGGAVSFNLGGRDASEVAFLLDAEYGIAVRAGLHCAPEAHRTLGSYPGGTVRVSPGFFNTEEDIAFFLQSLAGLARS
ncbi:aminotransferase class V-fold PLP-dependent enzyme [Geomonas sp. Red32]|uniref:aminotransferase class V-fold PLP-dependent enzyme n=1 Tax=Geomonas sp. Red32 TaxID=2912856 RepID=UPI00202D0807|nr:aminotransferase class V-fold PLP-dependent enzyme [Geomonas sp. Red32]MCM0083226.1 aminotransferase class V-fold PLP-dependent enzyme [Geomonas sp. Red32]